MSAHCLRMSLNVCTCTVCSCVLGLGLRMFIATALCTYVYMYNVCQLVRDIPGQSVAIPDAIPPSPYLCEGTYTASESYTLTVSTSFMGRW